MAPGLLITQKCGSHCGGICVLGHSPSCLLMHPTPPPPPLPKHPNTPPPLPNPPHTPISLVQVGAAAQSRMTHTAWHKASERGPDFMRQAGSSYTWWHFSQMPLAGLEANLRTQASLFPHTGLHHSSTNTACEILFFFLLSVRHVVYEITSSVVGTFYFFCRFDSRQPCQTHGREERLWSTESDFPT